MAFVQAVNTYNINPSLSRLSSLSKTIVHSNRPENKNIPHVTSLNSDHKQVYVRDPATFSEVLKYAIDQVTINEVANIVGSSAFEDHRYPSDVDIFEQVTVNEDYHSALKSYVLQFKNIMQKIMVNERSIIFSDFKAGEYRLFDVVISPDSTIEQQENIIQSFTTLPVQEITRLRQNLGNPTALNAIIREYKIIRWKPNDILLGQKTLIDGTIISLEQALGMDAIVKLDVIAWVYGRFHSIEVFYNLRYRDPITSEVIAYFPLGSYVQSLYNDVLKYSSAEYYSPLRLAKRLWTLSMKVDCYELLHAITPILKSDAAALNQMLADLDILENVLDSGPVYDDHTSGVFVEILSMSKRAANHLADMTVYHKLQDIINSAYNIWVMWKVNRLLDKQALYKILEQIRELLMPVILSLSDEFMRALAAKGIECPNIVVEEREGIHILLRV